MPRKFETLAERILARVRLANESDESSCWLFPFNIDAKGYGCISARVPGKRTPRRLRVHRIIFAWARGRTLRRDHVVDHRPECPKTCCNPDHLTCCTLAENTRRANYWRYRDDSRSDHSHS